MQPKLYWYGIRDKVLELKKLQEQIDYYQEQADAVGQGYVSMMTRRQPGYSRVENVAVRLADAIAAYDVKQKAYAPELERAKWIISKIRSPHSRKLMTLRYIEGKDWPEVEALMGYDNIMSLYKAHGRALIYADPYTPDP